MNPFELASELESKAVETEHVLAILAEAGDYFAQKKDRDYLPFYADQISALITVAAWLLRDMEKEMTQTANIAFQSLKNGN